MQQSLARFCLTGALAIVLLAMGATMASASRGAALVIGNSAYKHAAELSNPKNDANDIAAALEAAGFTVVKGIDLDRRGMEQTIVKFARALRNAKAGLFFYAGHALQIDGQNYLVPTDAQLLDSTGVDFELVRLSLVQRAMERNVKTNMIFLDACRNNPLSRNLARAMGTRSASLGNGLAPVESGIGTLISYSTQPGNVALDGDGRNSPYSAALVRHLTTTDGDISDVLINVRRDVMKATNRKQIPWEHSALTAKFYFKPIIGPTKNNNIQSKSGVSKQYNTFNQQAELAFWSAVQDSKNPAVLASYLQQYPDGKFAILARVMIEQLKSPNSADRSTKRGATQSKERTKPSTKPERRTRTKSKSQPKKKTKKSKSRPTKKPAARTSTVRRSCRKETRLQCRIRHCGASRCPHLRNTGVCKPHRLKTICK